MDGAGPQRPPADRADIEAAARDMGIVPGDPSYPFVQLMLQRHDQHALEHREHEGRIARLLDRAEAKAADTPRQPLARNEMVTIADAMDTVLLHRFARLNRWALGIAAGAGLLVGAICGGGGYWLGSRTEADKYVQVPADLGVALTGPSAAQWTNLMRLNDIGRAQRSCAPQAGGVACSISLWTQPPAARGN